MRPGLLVAGWAAANVVLFAILVLFREQAFAVVLYAASILIITVVAAIVWKVVPATPSREQRLRMGGSPVLPFPLALGLFLIGLGLIWGSWLVGAGVVVVLLAVLPVGRPRRLPPEPVPESVTAQQEPLVVPHRPAVPAPWERSGLRHGPGSATGEPHPLDRTPATTALAAAVYALAVLRGRPGRRRGSP